MRQGSFVISLDFELHWGIFDVKSVDQYQNNLDGTRNAIDAILDLSQEFDIRLTFATVGFLFARSKTELAGSLPGHLPSYADENLSPYRLLEAIGENEEEDPYHFSLSMIKKIANDKIHEIGTHTFCHYYCQAEGQTLGEFEADIIAAKELAAKRGIEIKSIVFPRNQVIPEYVEVCANHGISSYRGTEKTFVYSPTTNVPNVINKGLRLLDSYIDVFGPHTFSYNELVSESKNCVNIPSSRFLRPYNSKLSFIEPFKISRITKAMTTAAKHNQLYHLWWHPHNFGSQLDQNLSNLRNIFEHFQKLNYQFGFQSETMTSLQEKLCQ